MSIIRGHKPRIWLDMEYPRREGKRALHNICATNKVIFLSSLLLFSVFFHIPHTKYGGLLKLVCICSCDSTSVVFISLVSGSYLCICVGAVKVTSIQFSYKVLSFSLCLTTQSCEIKQPPPPKRKGAQNAIKNYSKEDISWYLLTLFKEVD